MGVAKRPLLEGEVCEDLRLQHGMITYPDAAVAAPAKAEKSAKAKKEEVVEVAEPVAEVTAEVAE